jgi:hypothetical protein
MRTTLDIDEDVLTAAKERAAKARVSLGRALTELARAGLTTPSTTSGKRSAPTKGRYALLPRRGEVITLEHVRTIADDEGV